MLGDGTEILTDSDDAEMFDDTEEKETEENDDEVLRRLVDGEVKDITSGPEKGKENARIDSTTSSKIAPPTDEKPKEVASK